jgi:FkbM family methyltransferase
VNLLSKIQAAAGNPAMLSAYMRWMGAKLVTGAPARVPLADATTIGEWVSFSEYWSFRDIIPEAERKFVKSCLVKKEPGQAIAFDIGANVGAFTCLMASFGQIVHSFEPIPETFCRLRNNVKFNGLLGRTHLNCLAVGKEQGLVAFQVEENAAATNHMATAGECLTGAGTRNQTVAAVSLDGYCASQGIESIDLLKIDVEGMEPYVIEGANKLFRDRRVAAALIEICPVNLHAVRLSPAALYKEFGTVNYSPYALSDEGQPDGRLSLSQIEAMSLSNVALLPDP